MIRTCRHRIARTSLAAIVGLVLGLSLAPLAAASPALDAANRAFAEGHYPEATKQYEALIDRQGYSAPALFDLGNAYLRDGKPVEAMLAYERARLLAPRDPDIERNFEEARKAAGVDEDRGLASRAAHFLTANEWTWLATAAVWLAVAAGGGAALYPRRRTWLARATWIGALAGTISIVALAESSEDQRTGLVLDAAPVLVSPFEGAKSSFSVRAGSNVELGRAHDSFVLVHDRRGRSGWMERSAVAPLVADGARLGA
ncbi:MAG TPA: tetratricopeptide repeat protein [Polyangiaceae bacterium]